MPASNRLGQPRALLRPPSALRSSRIGTRPLESGPVAPAADSIQEHLNALRTLLSTDLTNQLSASRDGSHPLRQLNENSSLRFLKDCLDTLFVRIQSIRERGLRQSSVSLGQNIDFGVSQLIASIIDLRESIDSLMSETGRNFESLDQDRAQDAQRQDWMRFEVDHAQERTAAAAGYVSALLSEQAQTRRREQEPEGRLLLPSLTALNADTIDTLVAPPVPWLNERFTTDEERPRAVDNPVLTSDVRTLAPRGGIRTPSVALQAFQLSPTRPAQRVRSAQDDGAARLTSYDTISRRLDHFNTSISSLHARLDRVASNFNAMDQLGPPPLLPPRHRSTSGPSETLINHASPAGVQGNQNIPRDRRISRPTLLASNAAGTVNAMDMPFLRPGDRSESTPTRQRAASVASVELPQVRSDTLMRVEVASRVGAGRRDEQERATQDFRRQSRRQRPETHGSEVSPSQQIERSLESSVEIKGAKSRFEATIPACSGQADRKRQRFSSSHEPLTSVPRKMYHAGVEYRLCYGLWLAEDGSEMPKE